MVVGAIPGLQSGGAAERGMAGKRQTRQLGTRQRRQKNTNNTIQKRQKRQPEKDKDELELGLWMLQLHAEGAGNSVRAGGCDIHIVVGYYAMLCKLYSKIKMCEYEILLGEDARKRLCRVLSTVYSLCIYQKMKKAIFGTFMWAAFIATFARKYMR